uniref:hypothetical protein n=1 Tax=Pasteurella multocida TaxID=747 RepID=UPI00403DD86A
MGILNSMSEAINKNKQSSQPQILSPSPSPTLTTQTPQNPPTLSNQAQPSNSHDTMAENVAKNLNSNSLLMNSAAAKGERMAASRGLQNSTLGIEASQRAMIDAAMPIAQVDTANQHQLNLQRDQQNFTANQAFTKKYERVGTFLQDNEYVTPVDPDKNLLIISYALSDTGTISFS